MFAALAALLIAGSANAYTGTVSLNASVSIYCPFSVSLNVSPGYIDYGNFTVNYTISTSEPCSLNNLNRKLDIYYPNSTLLHEYVATLKTVNTTPAKYYIAVNSSIFPASGAYPIKLTVSNLSYTSSATGAITLISTVNEKVTALSVPSSVKQFSQLPVKLTVTDNGGLASPNSTLAYKAVRGNQNDIMDLTHASVASDISKFGHDRFSKEIVARHVHHHGFTRIRRNVDAVFAQLSKIVARGDADAHDNFDKSSFWLAEMLRI